MKRLIALILTSAGLTLFYTSAVAVEPNVAPTEVYGEYVLNVTISVITPIPAGGSVYCTLQVVASDPSGTNSDSIIVQATVTGTPPTATGHCTLTLPFEWELSSPSTDLVSVSYDVGLLPGTATTPILQGIRTGTHSLPIITGIPGHVTSLGSVATRL